MPQFCECSRQINLINFGGCCRSAHQHRHKGTITNGQLLQPIKADLHRCIGSFKGLLGTSLTQHCHQRTRRCKWFDLWYELMFAFDLLDSVYCSDAFFIVLMYGSTLTMDTFWYTPDRQEGYPTQRAQDCNFVQKNSRHRPNQRLDPLRRSIDTHSFLCRRSSLIMMLLLENK